jgi:hypothetical protein
MTPDLERRMLRHTLATLSYRAGKALRGVSPECAVFRAGESTRTPVEILSHMGDLMAWALSIARGQEAWSDGPPRPWAEEVERFHRNLAELETFLASDAELKAPAQKIFQGPIADALTHTGQIALVRGMFGERVRGENYFRAEIETGRVGPDQAKPVREFD